MKSSLDIRKLPSGTRCLVDANILIYHLNGTSADCRDFLLRIANGEVQAFLTTTIVAEALHRQMLIEAVASGVVTRSKVLQKLKKQPELVGSLVKHSEQISSLLRLPFTILPIEASDISRSHQHRKRYFLFVNDSINLACSLRHRIKNIATHDTDFQRIANLKVWSPTDI